MDEWSWLFNTGQFIINHFGSQKNIGMQHTLRDVTLQNGNAKQHKFEKLIARTKTI